MRERPLRNRLDDFLTIDTIIEWDSASGHDS